MFSLLKNSRFFLDQQFLIRVLIDLSVSDEFEVLNLVIQSLESNLDLLLHFFCVDILSSRCLLLLLTALYFKLF